MTNFEQTTWQICHRWLVIASRDPMATAKKSTRKQISGNLCLHGLSLKWVAANHKLKCFFCCVLVLAFTTLWHIKDSAHHTCASLYFNFFHNHMALWNNTKCGIKLGHKYNISTTHEIISYLWGYESDNKTSCDYDLLLHVEYDTTSCSW